MYKGGIGTVLQVLGPESQLSKINHSCSSNVPNELAGRLSKIFGVPLTK